MDDEIFELEIEISIVSPEEMPEDEVYYSLFDEAINALLKLQSKYKGEKE